MKQVFHFCDFGLQSISFVGQMENSGHKTRFALFPWSLQSDKTAGFILLHILGSEMNRFYGHCLEKKAALALGETQGTADVLGLQIENGTRREITVLNNTPKRRFVPSEHFFFMIPHPET